MRSRTPGGPRWSPKHVVPVVAVVPIDEGDLEDMVLARAPEYLADMTAADEDLVGGRTRPAADVFEELDSADA
jgi:hypothetical protein